MCSKLELYIQNYKIHCTAWHDRCLKSSPPRPQCDGVQHCVTQRAGLKVKGAFRSISTMIFWHHSWGWKRHLKWIQGRLMQENKNKKTPPTTTNKQRKKAMVMFISNSTWCDSNWRDSSPKIFKYHPEFRHNIRRYTEFASNQSLITKILSTTPHHLNRVNLSWNDHTTF